MHKKQMFIISILLLASLVLSACGGAEPVVETEAPVVEAAGRPKSRQPNRSP